MNFNGFVPREVQVYEHRWYAKVDPKDCLELDYCIRAELGLTISSIESCF